jgi:hypothetical protein
MVFALALPQRMRRTVDVSTEDVRAYKTDDRSESMDSYSLVQRSNDRHCYCSNQQVILVYWTCVWADIDESKLVFFLPQRSIGLLIDRCLVGKQVFDIPPLSRTLRNPPETDQEESYRSTTVGASWLSSIVNQNFVEPYPWYVELLKKKQVSGNLERCPHQLSCVRAGRTSDSQRKLSLYWKAPGVIDQANLVRLISNSKA